MFKLRDSKVPTAKLMHFLWIVFKLRQIRMDGSPRSIDRLLHSNTVKFWTANDAERPVPNPFTLLLKIPHLQKLGLGSSCWGDPWGDSAPYLGSVVKNRVNGLSQIDWSSNSAQRCSEIGWTGLIVEQDVRQVAATPNQEMIQKPPFFSNSDQAPLSSCRTTDEMPGDQIH